MRTCWRPGRSSKADGVAVIRVHTAAFNIAKSADGALVIEAKNMRLPTGTGTLMDTLGLAELL